MANQYSGKELFLWNEVLIKERIANFELSQIDFAKYLQKKYKELAGFSFHHIRLHIGRLEKDNDELAKALNNKGGKFVDGIADAQKRLNDLKDGIKKKIKKSSTIIELANQFNVSPKNIEDVLAELKKENYNVVMADDKIQLSGNVSTGGTHRIDLRAFENKVYRFGFVTDDHLCNKAERLDVLNAIFDIYEDEGITEVFNGGNWIDGEARFNSLDIHTFGMDNQLDYFIKNYPQRNGIKIKFIAGDDHEGWYQQNSGIIIGKHLERKAEEVGRNDLEYLGYMEADVELKAEHGSAILRVVHAGGGTAYALSYQPQKLIESLTGGDKPHILLIGHYHKAEVLPSYRNVRSVQGGCGCDQTRFMRKKRIEAHVGGWIVEFQQAKDGSINRFKTEWLGFFDKQFYEARKYYV